MVNGNKLVRLGASLLLLAGVLLFPQACQKVEELRACEIDRHCGDEDLFRCVSETCVRRDPCGAGIFRFFGRGEEASPYIDALTPEAEKKSDDEILVRQVFSADQLREVPRQPTFDGEAMLLPGDGDRYAMRFEVDFFDHLEAKNTEARLDARNGQYLGVFVEARLRLNENSRACAAYMSVWLNKDNFAKICLGGEQGVSLNQGDGQNLAIPIPDPDFLVTEDHIYRIVYKPVVDGEELVYQIEIVVDGKSIATFSADEVQEPTEKPSRFVLYSFGSEDAGGSRWDYVRWGCNPDGGPCIQSQIEDDIQDCSDERNAGAEIACPGGRGVAEEICDGIDNNCDGTPDEVFLKTFGPTAILLPNPQDPTNPAMRLGLGDTCHLGECSRARVRCDPENPLGLICDPNAHFQDVAGPGVDPVVPTEVCNGLDDDCDGRIDEDFGSAIDGRSDAGRRRYVDIFDLPAARRGAGPTADDIQEFGIALQEACGKGVCGLDGVVECDPANGVPVCSSPPRDGDVELCGNRKDDDCDGEIDEGFDVDDDGFQNCDCAAPGRAEACDAAVLGQTDCNDNDRNIKPGATEVCNDTDDDCDGRSDEGLDEDLDGFWPCERACVAVPPACEEGVDCCNADPRGGSNLDCVDARNDPLSVNIHPGADELCNNIDDDCDDKIDEGNSPGELGFVTNPNGDGVIERGYFTPEHCGLCGNNCAQAPERAGKNWRNACAQGVGGIYECSTVCAEGFFDANGNDSDGCECAPLPLQNCGDADPDRGIAASTDCVELCDGFDNDCDGSIDEGAPITQAVIDALRQGGQRADLNQLQLITRPCFTGGEALRVDTPESRCRTGRMTCSGGEQVAGRPELCLGQVLPLDAEICNGIDDDCDGVIDENTPREGLACSVPGQSGVCSIGTFSCNAQGQEVCVSTYVAVAEVCNGVDDNCNGRIDEGFDRDGDGFTTCRACNDGEIPQNAGQCNNLDGDPRNDCICVDDCNDDPDSGGLINRSQAEACNEIDDDCDGNVDEQFVKKDATGNPVSRAGGLVYSIETAHCSRCGLDCSDLPNILRGSATCFDDGGSGACDFECLPNYEDRDGDWRNGCELAQCTAETVGAEAANRLGQPCSKAIYEDPDPNDAFDVCACRGTFTCVEVGQGQFGVQCIVNPLQIGIEGDTVSVQDCEAANGGERELIRNDRQESCDDFDNDCDGVIDEDFKDNRGNYSTLEHCGGCTDLENADDFRCAAANGAPTCINGVCTLEQADCAQNFYDANNDLTDGCEYFCVQRAQDDRTCNGEDDDCDGCNPLSGGCNANLHIDEDVRFDIDENNCGVCGNVCSFDNAVARCVNSTCTIDRPDNAPNTAGCVAGFADCDDVEGNGCEIQISADRNNCGGCGTVCDALGSDGCTGGVCTCGARSSCNDPNRPICDGEAAAGQECVECLQDEHCTGNPVFNNAGRQFCIDKSCRECDPVDSSGCAGESAAPICDRQSQSCRGCQNDAQCTVLFADRQVCITDGADEGMCVLCDPDTNAGCGGNEPTCERTEAGEYICRACRPDTNDCGGNRTCVVDDPATPENEARCSGCNVATNEGCANPTPICRAVQGGGERCEGCADNAECPAGQQCVEGSCRACDPQTHAGCAPSQLCCNFECVPTNGVNGCEVCGVACDDVNSRTCLNRECVCGAAGTGACGGATPFCDDPNSTCVSCRADADCPPGPRPLCVATDIGDGQTVPQCQECEPGTNDGCDPNSDTPFCDPDRYFCRGCAADAECGDPGRGQCVADGSCQLCDPADDAGCSPAVASVCTDQYQCVGCQTHEECADNPNGNICINERCSGCAGADADASCAGHPDGNVCLDSVNGAARRCGACDEDQTGDGGSVLDCDAPRDGQAAGHSVGNICRNNNCVACVADAECAVANANEPYCVEGRCQACDPDGDLPCSGVTPVCNSVTFQCEACQIDNDCNGGRLCVDDACRACDPDDNRGCAAGSPVCAGDPPACRPCVSDDECAGNPAGAFCHAGQCRACNPDTDAGCAAGGNTPVCSPAFECVGCGGDADCATNAENGDQCVNGACEACNPADHAGCGDDAVCCVANGAPTCEPTSGDAAGQCTACDTACDPQVADSCNARTCGCGDGAACDPAGAAPHCGPDGCEACLVDAHCAGDTVCNPTSYTCEPCRIGTNEGCGANQLCCDQGGGPVCINTGSGPEDSCTSCGASCDQARSNSCVNRECQCGAEGQCLGGTPFCEDTGGSCVQCLDDADCGAGGQCVNNSCGACDPQDNSGCNPSGSEPFCRNDGQGGTSCQGCVDDAECQGNPNNGGRCVLGGQGGACVDCLDNTDCGLGSNTPICTNNACARCTDDAQCAGNPNGANCNLVTGACVTCVDNEDCGLASGTPVCEQGQAGATCEACSADGDCAGNPNGTRCDGNGQCEDCVTNAHCDAASATPTCDAVSRDCRACAADVDCTGNANGGVCNVATGQCQACVDNDDCGNNELCCDIGAGLECVDTVAAARCGSCNQGCNLTTADACTERTCVCGGNAECGGGTPFCENSGCVECRTGNDNDCPGDEICRNNACGLADNAACVVDNECASGFCQPVNNVCRPAECNNGQQDPGEAGVDCGGQCGACNNVQCAVNVDCTSGFCQGSTNLCRPNHCGDGNLDAAQLEDEIDCGGPCGACDDDPCDAQNSGDSCASGYCQAATSLCRVATCGDGILSGNEVQQDCGGSCGACEDAACAANTDCASGYCQAGNNVCKPEHCGNGQLDAGEQETGVDCGGDCGVCPGLACANDGECASGFCEPETNVCRPAHCDDNATNNGETALNCGGPCSACNDSDCNDPSNDANDDGNKACASGFCQAESNQCRPATCGNGALDDAPGGDETAIDCGGSCGACLNAACDDNGTPNNANCANGFCHPELDICKANHCGNQALDGDETSLNCGGSCGACDNQACADNGSCASGYCQTDSSLCRPAHCGNNAVDGNDGELGQDCGGNCGLCNNNNCVADADCASGFCQDANGAKACRPATCDNGGKDLNETDVDCGGAECGANCTNGQACTQNGDCLSDHCVNDACVECVDAGDCGGGAICVGNACQ